MAGVSSTQVLLYKGCPLIRASLEDMFYCIEGVFSSESLEDRVYCIDGVLSSECPYMAGVSSTQVLLYRGCPLIRVSLEDRFHCIAGVLSSEYPLMTGTV